MGIFPNWNWWWHKPATKQMEQLPCMPVFVDLLSMQSIAVALGSGKSTFTRVLTVSLLAIVRVRSLLPGSSSSTSSQYAWNWRVSGTQNFRIWFSPGSVHSTPRRVRYSEHGFGVALASKGVVCWRPAVDSGCEHWGGGILIIHQASLDICASHHDAGSLWTFLNMCSFTKDMIKTICNNT